MIQTIISTLKATGLNIETEDRSGIKLRGFFKNQSIVICADNYRKEVLFLSTSLNQQHTYSYDEFFLKFCA
ncbi:MAG: hypothetical protein AAFO95_06175 [Cyanobacteria bacterium J06600_6]